MTSPEAATDEPLREAVTAIDKLISVELSTEEIGKYVRIEKLSKMVSKIRKLYSKRIGDLTKRSFDDDDYEDEGYAGAIRGIRNGGAINDTTELLRETLMTAQDAATKPKPLHPSTELANLIRIRESMKDEGESTDGITARIKELQEGFEKDKDEVIDVEKVEKKEEKVERKCPVCKSDDIVDLDNRLTCANCQHQWPEKPIVALLPPPGGRHG